MEFQSLCIRQERTVQQALRQLNDTAKKILFVINGENMLLAALTDGDVRRYLLAGGTLDDAVTRAGNHHPITARSREDALRLLSERNCIAVPVLDDSGHIEDIVLKGADVSAPHAALNLPVVIMAGGKGTRLEPYTKILPKPLIPVGDLPIMEHIMRQLRRFGCTEFHSVVNYKKQLIKAYFSENEQPYDIRWYDED